MAWPAALTRCVTSHLTLANYWQPSKSSPKAKACRSKRVRTLFRRILVIEDDRDALANLQDILELDGYSVAVATTIHEAKSQHTWSDYDVILLDRKLPDGNADTILPEIQRARSQPAAIIITGYTDFEGVVSALR